VRDVLLLGGEAGGALAPVLTLIQFVAGSCWSAHGERHVSVVEVVVLVVRVASVTRSAELAVLEA
jgi:hypothetical protein